MKCPIDGTALTMTERSGVEIDYCPQCRGIWLDRGELDKIVQRAGSYEEAQEAPHAAHIPSHNEHAGYTDRMKYRRKERRGSFLEDIFGVFGGD